MFLKFLSEFCNTDVDCNRKVFDDEHSSCTIHTTTFSYTDILYTNKFERVLLCSHRESMHFQRQLCALLFFDRKRFNSSLVLLFWLILYRLSPFCYESVLYKEKPPVARKLTQGNRSYSYFSFVSTSRVCTYVQASDLFYT